MITSAALAVPAAGPYPRIAWRILPFLMICYLVAYIDRVNVGFAKLQMSSDLGLSEAAYGFGAGIFFIGYALFEVPSNLMLHRVGARRWMARILVSWSIISASFGFVETETQFYILRFLLGVAEAGFAPGALLYLTYWFPAHHRARANGAMFLAIPLAGIIGAPVSGLIMEGMADTLGWAGWRWMFVLEAAPALVAGILAPWILPDGPAGVSWLSADQKRRVLDDLRKEESHLAAHLTLRDFLGDGRLWLLSAILFCVVMGQYALTFWMPTIVRNAGAVSLLHNGLLTGFPFVVAMAAMIAMSVSADHRRERRWHLIAPMAVGATALIGASLVPHNLGLSIALLSIATAGLLSATVMFWSLPPAFLGGIWAAVGIGAINAVGNIAGFVSPYVIGSLVGAGGDLRRGLWVIASVILIGAGLVLRIPKTVNR